MRDDQRRSAAQSIAMQARLFLKSGPIPRSDMSADPERDFLPAGRDSATNFDDFLDKKDSRGKIYLKDLGIALTRCSSFLQALRYYEDIKGERFGDLKLELLSRKIGLEKDVEKFESQGLRMNDQSAFGIDTQKIQEKIVRLKEDRK